MSTSETEGEGEDFWRFGGVRLPPGSALPDVSVTAKTYKEPLQTGEPHACSYSWRRGLVT